jgi:hypothetical protein
MKHKLRSVGRALRLPLAGVILCQVLTFTFTELLARFTSVTRGPGATLVMLSLGFLTLLLPMAFSLVALFGSLRDQPRSQAAALVLGGYLSVLLAFTSLFYLFSFIGDLVDTREADAYYADEATRVAHREPRYRAASDRAFGGVSARLWDGVEQHYGPHEDPRGGPPSLETILERVRAGEPAPVFQPQNRATVWFDCLHFSTVTIATLGYGDIVPKKWYSKAAVDLEVIVGLAFVSLSVGRLLSKKSDEETA